MTSQTPFLFIPGLLCDAALWAHQVQHLGDICAPRVVDVTEHDTLRMMARSVLEQAPPRFYLAGLSMGGYIAQEIMRQDPSRVIKLALLNTTARPDSEEAVARRKTFINLAKTGKFKGVTPRLLPYLIHPDRLTDPHVADVVIKMAERVGREAFINQQLTILSRPDGRPDLPNYPCETLVIVGRQDALTPPEHAEEMVRLIPKAKLGLIEDCGHLSPLERPQAVTALLRYWLGKVD